MADKWSTRPVSRAQAATQQAASAIGAFGFVASLMPMLII
jgi:hypothetical protein